MTVEADNCRLPAAAAALPVMPTDAVLGLPSDEPVALLNITEKDRVPEKGVVLLRAIEKLFAAESPSVHFRVPLVAV